MLGSLLDNLEPLFSKDNTVGSLLYGASYYFQPRVQKYFLISSGLLLLAVIVFYIFYILNHSGFLLLGGPSDYHCDGPRKHSFSTGEVSVGDICPRCGAKIVSG